LLLVDSLKGHGFSRAAKAPTKTRALAPEGWFLAEEANLLGARLDREEVGMKYFEPHPRAEDRKRSAVALIELLLANKKPEVLPEHLGELIKILIGKMTEADGKLNTRHWSNGALQCPDKKQLHHEHVYTRKRMIQALLNARPNESREILKDAIGCIVTTDEHRLLSTFDKTHDGWERYRKAKLHVRNTETGEQVIEDTD
jgi:hypothetical protein